MAQIHNSCPLRFVELLKELAKKYDWFCFTREIEDFDKANIICEEINDLYEMSLDLLDLVGFGRALLGKQTLPLTKDTL